MHLVPTGEKFLLPDVDPDVRDIDRSDWNRRPCPHTLFSPPQLPLRRGHLDQGRSDGLRVFCQKQLRTKEDNTPYFISNISLSSLKWCLKPFGSQSRCFRGGPFGF